jgi:hypothetical protein
MRPLPRAFLGAAPALGLLLLLRPVYGGSLWGVVLAGALGAALGLAGSLLAAVGPADLRRLWEVPRSMWLLGRGREPVRPGKEGR